jgi:hypothetical protein
VFAPPSLAPAERQVVTSPLLASAWPPDYDTAPPHGPPRTGASLRAPPSFSA